MMLDLFQDYIDILVKKLFLNIVKKGLENQIDISLAIDDVWHKIVSFIKQAMANQCTCRMLDASFFYTRMLGCFINRKFPLKHILISAMIRKIKVTHNSKRMQNVYFVKGMLSLDS
mgnify:CR=1 FL=1